MRTQLCHHACLRADKCSMDAAETVAGIVLGVLVAVVAVAIPAIIWARHRQQAYLR